MVLHTPRPSLATLPEFPSIGESLAFQLNGLIVVFLALGSIWGLLELMGLFFRQRVAASAKSGASLPTPAPAAASASAVTAAASATATAASPISPELTAVIAASIATVLKQPHRIRSISADAPPPTWAHEGRREIFGSHRIR